MSYIVPHLTPQVLRAHRAAAAAEADGSGGGCCPATDATYAVDWGTVDVLAGGNIATTETIDEFDDSRYGLPFATYNLTKPQAGYPPYAAGPNVLAESEFGTSTSERDASIEARYDSPQQYRARFSFGGYYYNNSSTQLNTFGVYAPNVPPGDELVFATYGFQTPNGKPVAAFNTAKTGVRDTSEFVSGEFDILKNLTLGEELRFLSEKQLLSSSLAGGNYDTAKFSPVTSRTTLSWKPTKDYDVYFSAANGEKSGGFNPTAATPADLTFAPETDWSYEFGVKSTLLDHRLILNADVFHTDIDGLQQLGAGSAKSAGGFTLLVVKNYGSVTENGFELEGKYTTDFGLVVGGGLALQDPRYSKGAYDTSDTLSVTNSGPPPITTNYGCAAIPSCASSRLVYLTTANGTQTVVPAGTAGAVQAIDLKGLHLPFAADFTLNLNAEYRHPVQWTYLDSYMPKAEWFARVDYRYESKEYADIPNFAYVDPKNIINLHAGIENYHWSATLALLNVTNDRTPIGANLGSQANGTDDVNYSATGAAYLPDGRTFSARFAFHY